MMVCDAISIIVTVSTYTGLLIATFQTLALAFTYAKNVQNEVSFTAEGNVNLVISQYYFHKHLVFELLIIILHNERLMFNIGFDKIWFLTD